MIPFYIYIRCLVYQRIGDLVWAAGDMQARGFYLEERLDVQRLQEKGCNTKMGKAT